MRATLFTVFIVLTEAAMSPAADTHEEEFGETLRQLSARERDFVSSR